MFSLAMAASTKPRVTALVVLAGGGTCTDLVDVAGAELVGRIWHGDDGGVGGLVDDANVGHVELRPVRQASGRPMTAEVSAR